MMLVPISIGYGDLESFSKFIINGKDDPINFLNK